MVEAPARIIHELVCGQLPETDLDVASLAGHPTFSRLENACAARSYCRLDQVHVRERENAGIPPNLLPAIDSSDDPAPGASEK